MLTDPAVVRRSSFRYHQKVAFSSYVGIAYCGLEPKASSTKGKYFIKFLPPGPIAVTCPRAYGDPDYCSINNELTSKIARALK